VLLTLGLALWLPLASLARGTSYLVLVVFALVNAALYLIKQKNPAPKDVLNTPLWVPATGFIACSGLLLFQLLSG
jgi:hypothetical protein